MLVSKRGIKVTAEMGGKNPVVVLEDADLNLAVSGIVGGAFGSKASERYSPTPLGAACVIGQDCVSGACVPLA